MNVRSLDPDQWILNGKVFFSALVADDHFVLADKEIIIVIITQFHFSSQTDY